MHCQIDSLALQCLFYFLREQSLAADLIEISVLDAVAGCHDRDDFDLLRSDATLRQEAGFDLLRLDDC
jgi:hypothetical protein